MNSNLKQITIFKNLEPEIKWFKVFSFIHFLLVFSLAIQQADT